MTLQSVLLFVSSIAVAHAYPRHWVTGDDCGNNKCPKDLATTTLAPMGIGTFDAGGTANCVIKNVPTTFAAATEYTLTVESNTASAMILQASTGSFTNKASTDITAGNKITNTNGGSTTTSHSFKWTSPDTGSADMYAICITSYGGDAWKSTKVTTTFSAATIICESNCLTCSDTTTCTKCNAGFVLGSGDCTKIVCENNCNACTSTTMCTTCSTGYTLTNNACVKDAVVAPAPAVAGGTSLSPDLSITGILSDDKATMDFTLTSTRNAWVAFGVTTSGGGMTASGAGSDVTICTKDSVPKRYVIKSRSKPSNGKDVTGASCEFSNGGVVMKFTRNVAATDSELKLTPGTKQAFIWALGKAGDTSLTSIHTNKGEVNLDVSTLATSSGTGTIESVAKPMKWSLWLHIICMGSAWGLILPWGVAIANRLRNFKKDTSPGYWFWLHKNLQYAGWLIQLLGFVFVVVYVSSDSAHFQSPHTWIGLLVVVLGTLQPLNAFFRPHPSEETGWTKRKIWEYVHKGSGYTAVVFGMFNVIAGALLTHDLGFNQTPMIVGLLLGIPGIVSVIGFCIGHRIFDQSSKVDAIEGI